jgi:hypothetical protein
MCGGKRLLERTTWILVVNTKIKQKENTRLSTGFI